MKFFGTFFCDRLYVYDSVLYTEFCFEYDSVMFILKNCKSYFFSKKSFLQKKAYSVMFLEKSIDLFGLICVAITFDGRNYLCYIEKEEMPKLIWSSPLGLAIAVTSGQTSWRLFSPNYIFR